MTMGVFQGSSQVTVRRVIYPQAFKQPDPAYRMAFAPVDQPSNILYIPYAPVEVTHNHNADYADVNRPGKKPALVYTNQQRKTMSFTLVVADKYLAVPGQPTSPVQTVSASHVAITIADWSRLGTRLRITYGYFETNVWRITQCTINTKKRRQDSNDFAHAEIDLTLSEVQDPVVGTGPVSGGVKPAPSKTTTTAPKTRTYTVKRGDTLYGISIKYYGTGGSWRRIADANKIKDPDKLKVGQKLKIP